jgi:hypothetical protein
VDSKFHSPIVQRITRSFYLRYVSGNEAIDLRRMRYAKAEYQKECDIQLLELFRIKELSRNHPVISKLWGHFEISFEFEITLLSMSNAPLWPLSGYCTWIYPAKVGRGRTTYRRLTELRAAVEIHGEVVGDADVHPIRRALRPDVDEGCPQPHRGCSTLASVLNRFQRGCQCQKSNLNESEVTI